MADKRSGPPSRGGFGGGSKGGFSKGGASRGGPSRGGASRGGASNGGFSRGGSSGGGFSRDGAGRSGGARSDFRKPRDFGDRPQRGGNFEERPRRDFGDNSKRRDFGDDSKRRDFGDDSKRRDFGDRPQRRDFGDRPQRNDRPRDDRSRGDRPQRGDNFESRAPRRDRDMPFDDRPRRSFKQEGFGASRRRDDSDTMRPNRDDRAPRRDFGDNSKRRDFGDRPRDDRAPRTDRRDYASDRAPRRDFGDRPQRSFNRDGGFDSRKSDTRKFESRQGFDKRPSGDKPREFKVDASMEKSVMKGHELVIFGVHAVQAALQNPKRVVTNIWVTDIGEAHLAGAYDAARHPETVTITRREIEQKLPDGAVHQGIAIAVEPLEEMYLSDILSAANSPHAERQLVVILDEVTDPHNVGAIMRSMSMFGARALVVHKRNAPSITGTMAKIATGAVEHIPMIPVTNLAKAMEELKIAGFFCLGLDEDASINISEAPKEGHLALVLGAEGDGLREKTRTTCDAIASIPSLGEIKSLNVSNAAAIALFSVRS